MKNPEQYKNEPVADTGTVPVTPKKSITTKTGADIKIEQLEQQLVMQHKEILKLRRDIGRLKSDLSDIVNLVRNRG